MTLNASLDAGYIKMGARTRRGDGTIGVPLWGKIAVWRRRDCNQPVKRRLFCRDQTSL
jgi:hypothetical protein